MDHPILEILKAQSVQPSISITFKPESWFHAEEPRNAFAELLSEADPSTLIFAKNSAEVLKKQNPLHLAAATALLGYVMDTFPDVRPSFSKPLEVKAADTIIMDASTIQSLEIVRSMNTKTKKGSLLSIIDMTKTASGSRLLASRLKAPSTCIDTVNQRLDLVSIFYNNTSLLSDVRNILGQCKDVERSLQRLHTKTGNKNDFSVVSNTLERSMFLRSYLQKLRIEQLQPIIDKMVDLSNLAHNSVAFYESVDETEESSGCISAGLNSELDELRDDYQTLMETKEALNETLCRELGNKV
jgi:DNA mismatch repair protein MutS